MADPFANVPVDETGPLPIEVASLEFIPKARREFYSRTMAGGFRLTAITADDVASRDAHLDLISAGKLKIFAAGTTRESLAEAEREAAASKKFFEDALARMDAEDETTAKAAFEKKKAAAIAKLEAAWERQRRGSPF